MNIKLVSVFIKLFLCSCTAPCRRRGIVKLKNLMQVFGQLVIPAILTPWAVLGMQWTEGCLNYTTDLYVIVKR
jgi:hypothetical protein